MGEQSVELHFGQNNTFVVSSVHQLLVPPARIHWQNNKREHSQVLLLLLVVLITRSEKWTITAKCDQTTSGTCDVQANGGQEHIVQCLIQSYIMKEILFKTDEQLWKTNLVSQVCFSKIVCFFYTMTGKYST